MSKAILKMSAIILIIAAGAGWYFGAYLPYQKSTRFIEVIRSGSTIKSLAELERRFDSVLDFYSPVSRDETLSFFAEQMVNVIGNAKIPQDIAAKLIDYTVSKLAPVLDNPRSPELTKILLKVGNLYQIGWLLYGDDDYFRKAESYLKEGLAVSPNRPQFLYTLFELYRAAGRKDEAKAVGEKILSFWPNDNVLRAKFNAL